MHTTFFLKGVSKEQLLSSPSNTIRTVHLYYKCKDGQFRPSTEVRVRECDWVERDKKGIVQRVNNKITGGHSLNTILDQFQLKAENYIQSCKIERKFVYKKDLEQIFAKEEKQQPKDKGEDNEMFLFIQDFIDYQADTVKNNYEKLLRHLKAFNQAKDFGISWDKLDERFYCMYTQYLASEYPNPQGKTGILNSTIGKGIGNLKKVCRIARKKGFPVNSEVFEFKKPSYQTKRLFITEEELERIISLDLSSISESELCEAIGKKRKRNLGRIRAETMRVNLDKIRDCYVFGFETGLRFSDMVKLRPEHITYATDDNGRFVKVIDFSQTKTRSGNIVPLSDRAISILKKWEMNQAKALPIPTGDQVYTNILRRLFKLSGLTDQVTITRWKGNTEVIETFQLWEKINPHSSRHSCAQDLLDKTDDIGLVSGMLGHKSIKTTEIYAINNKKKFLSKVLRAKNENQEENLKAM